MYVVLVAPKRLTSDDFALETVTAALDFWVEMVKLQMRRKQDFSLRTKRNTWRFAAA